MTKKFHWSKEDYFPYLLQNFKNAVLALEYLVDDLHISKEETIDRLLGHISSEEFLWGIVKLMSSDNLRVSGNSAYVFGTIAETMDGINRILNLLNSKSHPESLKILSYLVKLLKSTDYECMMNAAGTIGTISESNLGRSWLIDQPLLDEVIELSTNLLDNQNIWVSSNAALVIARISIEENGCEKILSHQMSQKILQKLISALGCDNAGRGMNCAFAIGRICDHENGRLAFLKFTNMDRLIELLSLMIEQNLDNGCTKNACYALSCLAVNQEAHQITIDHTCFIGLIETLCKLLLTVKDPETQWFAAMLLRIFSTFPCGCIKMKSVSFVWQTLFDLSKNKDLYTDVKEEITIVLDTLKPLEKPNPIRATVQGSSKIFCEWDPIILKNKLTVKYLLFKETECIYTGSDPFYTVENLEPCTLYSFSVQILAVETNEKSLLSDPLFVQTDESIPTEPLNLKAVGSTTSIIKISWEPPKKLNGILKCYYVYNGENLVEQTNDLTAILTGLQADNSYEISVCASTSKGKGEKASIRASTCSVGDILPEKPVFGLVGRREILVRWQPPQVLTGKLTRYDLNMNSKCVYSGISPEYQVTMLKPDNEYKFEVVAITTEGKFRSKISKVRTLKDEYDPDRPPLYPGSASNQSTPVREKSESAIERKKSSATIDKRILLSRQKSKPKIVKEVLQTTLCEEFGIDQNKKIIISKSGELLANDSLNFSNTNSINTNNTNKNNNQSAFFPPLAHSQSLNDHSKSGFFSDESSALMNRPSYKMNESGISLYRGKSLFEKSKKSKQNEGSIKNFINNSNTTSMTNFTRSKTIASLHNKRINQSQSPVGNATFVQPTTLTLNIKEMSPKFPLIPIVASMPQSAGSNVSSQHYQAITINNSNNQIPSVIHLKNSFKNRTYSSSDLKSKSLDKKLESVDLQLEYQYLLNKLNKSKALEIDEDVNSSLVQVMNRPSTYVNSRDYQVTKSSK